MIKLIIFLAFVAGCFLVPSLAKAQETDRLRQSMGSSSRKILTTDQWNRVGRSIERGLGCPILQPIPDGSFQIKTVGQPGVTSLCVTSFLANGYLPSKVK